ncbi:hypothetical protein L6R29_00745 [Myxococcota bacterium]|nr:hypothetical protein [Myxococcota bacterium]
MTKTEQIWWSEIDDGSVEMSDQQGPLYEAGRKAHKRLPQGKITEVTLRCPTIRVWHIQSLFKSLPAIDSLLLLHDEEIEEGVFAQLSQFPNLTSLVIGAAQQPLRPAQLQELLASTRLEELHLGTLEQTEGILAPLTEQKRIKTLSLSAFEGPASLLRDVAKMTWLETFSLAFESNFSAEGWRILSEMEALPSLSLYFYGQEELEDSDEAEDQEYDEEESLRLLAEDTDFSFLQGMRALRSFELECFSLSEKQAQQIASLAPRLQELDCEDCFFEKGALEAFAALTEMRTFALAYCESESSVDWGFLEKLFSLEDFAFSAEELPKGLLPVLFKISSLRRVSLVLDQIEDKDLKRLEKGFGPHITLDLDILS